MLQSAFMYWKQNEKQTSENKNIFKLCKLEYSPNIVSQDWSLVKYQ